MSPVIGNKYIYLPLMHYNNYSSGGPGAVIAVKKDRELTREFYIELNYELEKSQRSSELAPREENVKTGFLFGGARNYLSDKQ